MKKRIFLGFIIVLFAFSAIGWKAPNSVNYSSAENWAILSEEEDKSADVFLICPTVDMGDDTKYNMNLDDDKIKKSFVGALNMEIGIYDQVCAVFAPYYRQMTLSAYEKSDISSYINLAYKDVKKSFIYYFENYNKGRPFILAGFSQGSQLGLMLMQDLFKDPKYSDKLIAAYLLGWRITDDIISDNEWIKMAQGETDTGCIISFNSESPTVKSSFIVPKGTKTLAINPLNWKTDSTPASASKNIGACFTDYSGNIKKEIPNLTGAYLDSARGTLKVPDISAEQYPPVLKIFLPGEYHLYDYQFFYRNLQENVSKRVDSYLNK